MQNTRNHLIDCIVYPAFLLTLCCPLLFTGRLWVVSRSWTHAVRFTAAERDLASGFPGRHTLTACFYRGRYMLFGSVEQAVAPGKDGWLFLGVTLHGTRPRAGEGSQLEQADDGDRSAWRALAAHRAAMANALHTDYLCVVPPNKIHLYPEFMSARMQDACVWDRRAAECMRTLNAASPGMALDLWPVLNAEKSLGQLYYRTDTHWTPLGAYCAYRAILGRLHGSFPALQPIAQSEFLWETSAFSGDLANMAWLENVLDESVVGLAPRRTFPAHLADGSPVLGPGIGPQSWPDTQPRFLVTDQPDRSLPTAVIFHDSFMKNLMPYLAQHFRHALWRWGDLDWGVVERERPDILIYEKIERDFDLLEKERLP